MKPEHIVTLIAVGLAVVVIALFLIAIVVELGRTHRQLITILGAVSETVDRTDGLEALTVEISQDLAAGHAALGECVQRLEQRLGGGAAGSGPGPDGDSRPGENVFSNY